MSKDTRKKTDTETVGGTVDGNEPFLSRWSRRKALAREGIEPEEPDPAEESAPATATPAAGADQSEDGGAGASDAESAPTAEAAELPPLESLDGDSDYSAFLAADVAPDLQRQALRKLFRSPKFNLRDGLDDYDLDYTNPAPLGDVVTAEMRHRIARELERLAARASEDPAPAPDEPTVAAAPVDTGETERPDADAGTEPEMDDERSDTA